MYPYIRAVSTIIAASRQPRMGLWDTHVSHHRAWPWDTDIFGELNHGRILTLLELGRWGMTMRLGLGRWFAKSGLGLSIAGALPYYRRRVPIFSRYEMRSQFVGYDDKFIYAVQSMWQGETACNEVGIRIAFVRRHKLVSPQEVFADAGITEASPELPEWILAWSKADALRPWPPER